MFKFSRAPIGINYKFILTVYGVLLTREKQHIFKLSKCEESPIIKIWLNLTSERPGLKHNLFELPTRSDLNLSLRANLFS